MRNVVFLISVLSLVLFTYSCKKDHDEDLADTITHQQQTNTTPAEKRTCGLATHMEQLMKDPKYKAIHELKSKD